MDYDTSVRCAYCGRATNMWAKQATIAPRAGFWARLGMHITYWFKPKEPICARCLVILR